MKTHKHKHFIILNINRLAKMNPKGVNSEDVYTLQDQIIDVIEVSSSIFSYFVTL